MVKVTAIKNSQEKRLADIKALLAHTDAEGDRSLKSLYSSNLDKYQEATDKIDAELIEVEQMESENKDIVHSYKTFRERYFE